MGIMLDDNGALLCVNCNGVNLHPLDVFCTSADDGSPPVEGFKIEKPDGHIIVSSVTVKNIKTATPNVGNRARELDTVLRFWCENCNTITRLDFGFHKGSVLFLCDADKEKIKIEQ